MAGMLNIGITGLAVSQYQLNTTSHNIVNANTEGYTRQRVTQISTQPQRFGNAFVGNGANVSGVDRQYSQFLTAQLRSADNRRAELAAYNEQISQINNLVADPNAGLSPAISAFFAGMQDVSANPANVPARQALVSNAQSLVSRLNSLDQRLDELRSGVEGEIKGAVDRINELATDIADVNQRIIVAQTGGPGVPANDLLDARDALVTELNGLIRTTTVDNGDGRVNVFIGSGQALVMGSNASQLRSVPDANDPQRTTIYSTRPDGSTLVPLPERLLTGGKLGGLLAFRTESLDLAQNQLGLVALSMATQFNEQHKLGSDLNGQLGANFFDVPAPTVVPATGAAASIDLNTLSELTGADYELRRNAGNYTLTNLVSGASTSIATGGSVTFEGLTINTAASTLAAGDIALIRPTRDVAGDIRVSAGVAADPRLVAAAAPVSANVPVSNGGDARVRDITLTSVTGMGATAATPHFAAFSLSWDANTLTVPAGYTLAPNTSFNPATDATGKSFTLTHTSGYSWSFTLAGTPASGDTFGFQSNADGVADNRNAALLGDLQVAKTMLAPSGGNATANFQSAYSQLVSTIGNKAREVQVGERTQTTLVEQATAQRDSLSGVNLDEEAANLVRFQQAYQASGRVMSVAQRLFDEVLSIAR